MSIHCSLYTHSWRSTNLRCEYLTFIWFSLRIVNYHPFLWWRLFVLWRLFVWWNWWSNYWIRARRWPRFSRLCFSFICISCHHDRFMRNKFFLALEVSNLSLVQDNVMVVQRFTTGVQCFTTGMFHGNHATQLKCNTYDVQLQYSKNSNFFSTRNVLKGQSVGRGRSGIPLQEQHDHWRYLESVGGNNRKGNPKCLAHMAHFFLGFKVSCTSEGVNYSI